MKICIVDCVGNLGGGTRFTIQMINSFIKQHPKNEYHLFTFGEAFTNYTNLLEENQIPIQIFHIKTKEQKTEKILRLLSGIFKKIYNLLPQKIKNHFPLKNKLAGFITGVHYFYDVSACNFENYDIIWFPWIHRHIVPLKFQKKIFASFHDAIIFEFPEYYITSKIKIQDMENTRKLFQSDCNIIFSSNETEKSIHRIFKDFYKRDFQIIPLAGNHKINEENTEIPGEWTWFHQNYILYPANTSNHKNHEVLFRGIAIAKINCPLILTGEGTKLEGNSGRVKVLNAVANDSGLRLGDTLIGLGYIPENFYSMILANAWAIIMPSLAEGGGSFPIWEALLSGIPVICSDIPVIREQIDRIHGKVIFFDPKDPEDLAGKITYLNENYPAIKEMTVNNIPNIMQRTWDDVAADYWNFFIEIIRN